MTDLQDSRTEKDSLGEVTIEKDKLWGSLSQRSLQNFAIGNDRFPWQFIHDFALVKKAAALANNQLGVLADDLTQLISSACDAILQGQYDDQFPLSVWQTGSGTQTNMNLNEVIANLGNREAGQPLGSRSPLHPNDHVNRSQSSNDVFPAVMHVTASRLVTSQLLPALQELADACDRKQEEFADKIKSGRTHMMDAIPVTLGQEFGAFNAQLKDAAGRIESCLEGLSELAIGGTAVGTGLNTPANWAVTVVEKINQLGSFHFKPATNKFSQLASHDALTSLHSQLNLLATVLMKIANDLRLMNSGPRCGLAEIRLPANEPGSSIMPGKVNPTQIEALTMVCARVMGNNTAVSIANSQGQFQLNVYKPLIIHAILESLTLLTDAMQSFTHQCVAGIQANDERLDYYTNRSLMLITALGPHVGYDAASKAAHYALDNDVSLKQAVTKLGLVSPEDYDKLVNPRKMLGRTES